MRALFRLLAPVRTAPKTPVVQRDRLPFVLDDGSRIDVLRVRDPRAKRVKLSDEQHF